MMNDNKDRRRSTKERTLKYSLDQEKALAKKIDSCDVLSNMEEKGGNFYISLSTAVFETFGRIILLNVHMPRGNISRKLEYIADADDAGNIVQDIKSIRDWQALSKNLSQGNTGPISSTINQYRTKSSAMVNGKDGAIVAAAIKNLLNALRENNQINNANVAIKASLKQMATPSRLPRSKRENPKAQINEGNQLENERNKKKFLHRSQRVTSTSLVIPWSCRRSPGSPTTAILNDN